MIIKCLTIAGFRGFNSERTIYFNDRLTLISAPNSHGKTSISEALEFLLYGATSKVEHADSKEEYKDSYRNCHYPLDKAAYIETSIQDDSGTKFLLRVELESSGVFRRLVDGKPAACWPFHSLMEHAARPFILQHALKYLLLVPPTERFQGFASLLGLNDVDRVYRALVNLSIKPEATIPPQAKTALTYLETLQSQFLSMPVYSVPQKLDR
jgi:predicted ATP-binding protein involved in virulence